MLKKHIRLGHAGIVDLSVDLSITDLKKKSIKKKEWTEATQELKYYINAKQQITVPYGGMLHIPPTNLLLAAKQKPYKKAYLVTKNID